eukprot:1529267-Pleurochrysis_carterae.AAC.1
MSRSGQFIATAAARMAPRSSWRSPPKRVSREDGATGRQSEGSAQSHTVPRAHGGISNCEMVTVGTWGTCTSLPCARSRSAYTAASADASHVCTLCAYTPGMKRSAMAIYPAGRAAGALGCVGSATAASSAPVR